MTASTIPSIGIDFGGTSIKLGVVRGTEVIAHAPSIATQEYGNPDQLIEAIAQFVNMLRLNHPEVQAIGMGMPGFVNFYKAPFIRSPTFPAGTTFRSGRCSRLPADCRFMWRTTPTVWRMRNGSWAQEEG